VTTPSPLEQVRVLLPHVRVSDPHVCSDDRARLSLLRAVYESLVRRGDDGRHRSVLAERWTASPDARTWTFQLRPDVAWHDGSVLRAEDVVASLTRIRDEPPEGELGTSGVYQGYLAGATIEVAAPGRVRIDLPAPMADLLDILAELVILRADDVARSDLLPAGTGPFQWEERSDDQVVLARFERYWGARSPVGRVIARAEPDATARLEAARAGTCDIAADIDLRSTTTNDRLRIRPGGTTTAFMANLREGPLTDRRVRQALNYATDVGAVISTLFGGHADAVASPCTSPHLGFDRFLAPYPHDRVRARTLLSGAGVEGLRLRFDVPEVLPDEAVALGELLAEQFAAVGVDLELERHADRPAYAERVRDGRIHDAACFDSTPVSTFRLFREKFHGGVQGTWWLGHDDPVFDAAVDEATATPDPSRRAGLYRKAAGLLHRNAPWIYLYAPRWGWATSPAVDGWRPSPEGWVDLAGDRFGPAGHDTNARS